MKKATLVLAGMLFSSFINGTAIASDEIYGQVDEMGPDIQVKVGTHYESQMYARMIAYCGGTAGHYFHVTLRSGNTPAQIANFRNMYDTFLTAWKEKFWLRLSGDCDQAYITLPAHKLLVHISRYTPEASLPQGKSE